MLTSIESLLRQNLPSALRIAPDELSERIIDGSGPSSIEFSSDKVDLTHDAIRDEIGLVLTTSGKSVEVVQDSANGSSLEYQAIIRAGKRSCSVVARKQNGSPLTITTIAGPKVTT